MLEIISKKNKDEKVIYECYTFNGYLTAQKYFNPDINFQLHRNPDKGPALTLYYYPSGEVLCERYLLEGKNHRPSSEGPAYIRYLRDGEIDKVEYWENGVFLES